MKKILLSTLSLMGACTMMAQFYVYDTDGKVLFYMKDSRPAYIEFETPTSPIVLANTENNHKYVDLGLTSGTLWATCNVGAINPEDYGDYFSWGEVESKDTYDWSTYKHCDGSYEKQIKYCTTESYGKVDNKTKLESKDDAAVINWEGRWNMPTYEQQTELRDECYWVWTEKYNGKDVKGYIVYKAKNEDDKGVSVTESDGAPSSAYKVSEDTHIFLPAAGYRSDSILDGVGSRGFYWSNSLDMKNANGAFFLDFGSKYVSWYDSDRYLGFSVRPVVNVAK